MKKNIAKSILILIIVFVLTGCGSKSNINEDNKVNDDGENVEQKVKSDFWLGNANIPTKTKTISKGLIDGNDSVPIDLEKIDSSYSFNYINYPESSKPEEIKVNSILEVKGNEWDGSTKKVEIKDNNGEIVNTLNIHSECNGKKYNTFEEALENNCWLIDINEDRIFGKKIDLKTVDGVVEIMNNLFDLFGKPTHIYVKDDSRLVLDDDETGSLLSNIVYEYKGFKLRVKLSDTYNKKYDYRTLTYYGLVYVPDEIEEKSDGLTKDIINELVK